MHLFYPRQTFRQSFFSLCLQHVHRVERMGQSFARVVTAGSFSHHQISFSLSIFCSHRGEDGTRVSSDQGCNCRQFLSSSNLFRPLPASFVHITERPDGGKIFARSVGSSGEKSSSPNLFPSLFLPCPFVRSTECCQGSSSK